MNLKRLLATATALCTLALFGHAEVKDGDTYKCGPNGNVTVSIENHATTSTVSVTYSQGDNSSVAVDGTQGASGGATAESADEAPIVDGPRCRIHKGKLQYKNAKGKWINATTPRKLGWTKVGGGGLYRGGAQPPSTSGTGVLTIRAQTGGHFVSDDVGTSPFSGPIFTL